VETTNFFPFKGAGWYEAELVYYACKKKIIKQSNIIEQYKSSYSLDVNNFEQFIKAVYTNFEDPKYAINTLIGIFGHDYK
jgi:hypothetical protein